MTATELPTTQWLTGDEQLAWRAFVQMYTALTTRLNRDLIDQSNISDSDYAVLVHLSESPGGRRRAFELGRAIHWEKSRLSHHLTRMARRGLIQREDCLTDARGAFISLTATGWSTIRLAAPRHADSVRRYFVDVLSPAQRAAIVQAGEAVVAAVELAEAPADTRPLR